MSGILIIGGNSRLGIALRNHPKFSGIYVCRNQKCESNGLFRHSYFDLKASDFEGFNKVINLVGTNSSDPLTLQQINVQLVDHLALRAAEAGVQNFVNISSFAVFGTAPEISELTEPSPKSAYGQSKLDAEVMLRQKVQNNFNVTNVRLPMLYGEGASKLRMLLKLWSKIRYLPVPSLGSKRSMLHYDLAAESLIEFECRPGFASIAMADPETFRYGDVANIMSDCAGRRVSALAVGGGLLAPLNFFAPRIYSSLYCSSFLAPSANALPPSQFKSRLYEDVHKMAAQIYG
jgi:nucleoside-diphosphate-sugar epimerase